MQDNPFRVDDIVKYIGDNTSLLSPKEQYRVVNTWSLTTGESAVDIRDSKDTYYGSFYARDFEIFHIRDYSEIKSQILGGTDENT